MPAPRDAAVGALRLASVEDIYKHVRILVGMVSNCWGWGSCGKQKGGLLLPTLVRVHGGKGEVILIPPYLVQELGPALMGTTPTDLLDEVPEKDVYLRQSTIYFKQIILMLKLRWMLRLHSACCEIDYKMCSLRPLIQGLQYCIVQQHAEMPSDSMFEQKVSQHIGSHLNLESVLDDVVDQLKGNLGGAWTSFIQFVSSCDPSRSLMSSKMDSMMTQPQVVSNDQLASVLNVVFVANFLRQSRKDPASSLRALYVDLDLLGLARPEIPPLRGAPHLRAFCRAKTKPSRQDRERASRKDSEKLAQLDAVLLTAAVELHLSEILATPEELANMAASGTAEVSTLGAFSLGSAPEPIDFGSTGKSDNVMGPPAARVIAKEKPMLSPLLFDLALHCVHHHLTFPDGIRERLYLLLVEEYGLTQEQSQRLAISMTQNIDGKRLPEDTLLGMEKREQNRLREFQAKTHRDTSHLLVSPLVAAPVEKGKPAKYSLNVLPPGRAAALQSTRSLPDLGAVGGSSRGFLGGSKASLAGDSGSKFYGAEPFKVPLQTGPLTWDPEARKLRTTGLFIKMPPL